MERPTAAETESSAVTLYLYAGVSCKRRTPVHVHGGLLLAHNAHDAHDKALARMMGDSAPDSDLAVQVQALPGELAIEGYTLRWTLESAILASLQGGQTDAFG